MKWLKLKRLKKCGVALFGREIYVESDVVIEGGTTLYSPCYITGKSKICCGSVIYPCCQIENSFIGKNSVVNCSVLSSAKIGEGCTVGPFAYLRAGTDVGDGCRVGDFVEIKNSSVGEGTKVAHLSYVGDASVGNGVNVGCGVVFANYDGLKKMHSVVGDNCFIGCNCNIVAPVSLGDGAYIACGTTVVDDVESGDLCIGRSRQSVKKHGASGRYDNG